MFDALLYIIYLVVFVFVIYVHVVCVFFPIKESPESTSFAKNALTFGSPGHSHYSHRWRSTNSTK